MTRQRSLKERIRARMEKTGESYSTARRRLIDRSQAEERKRRTPRTIARVRTSDPSVVRASTGRTWIQWFKLLDSWGAKDKKHTEIARWLTDEQAVDGWWAQSITVAYEQERGMRAPGQRADGTYSVSASKTVEAPVDRAFEAFRDEALRARWLGPIALTLRTIRPAKSMTAAWDDGATRIAVSFTVKGAGKSQISLAHEKIADAPRAGELKAFWRERMAELKKLLEAEVLS